MKIQTDIYKRQVNFPKTNKPTYIFHTYLWTEMQKFSLGLLELKNKTLQLVLLHRSHFFKLKLKHSMNDNLHKYSIYLLLDKDDED